jgi:mRNA-degrading endonuclease RelE of RelBE toxin-antitoxin system
MVFIESALFTKYLQDYLNDDEYRELQSFLNEQPDSGDLIQGTGGLRKLRWSQDSKGKGKRGGVRVIYYWQVAEDQIYLFTLYSKNEMSDLIDKEKKALKLMLETWQ